ncbi:MAG TPA: GNVR domain-containing protein [Pyrinomonadaceae bacterium]|nr:GNVR domain-containing protein [Pyrinomonadaceae bacterium]
MSVEFRQRKPAEYGRILWRRKWVILLPALAVSAAVTAVVWRLPNVYQSTSLLMVRPSTLSQGIAPQLSDDELTIRINQIGQKVFSRTTLEPLIVNYNLYAADRRRGVPMESLVERMKTKDIRIELHKSREITNGFELSYRGPTPQVAKDVTARLASEYTREQMSLETEGAASQLRFIEDQLRQAREELTAVDNQRLSYLQQNLPNLPTSQAALVQRLTGLYEQQKSYVSELGRLRDQRTAVSAQIGTIQKVDAEAKDFVAETETDPKTTLAWAELSKQESELESAMQAMLAGGLRPKNPDVAAKRQELESVQKRKQRMLDEWEEKIEQKKRKLEGRTNPSLVQAENSMRLIEGEIARQERQLEQTRAAIGELEARVNRIPAAEVGLSAIEREYQTKKAAHDNLLEKQQRARLQKGAADEAQAATIQVIDPASLPEKPVAPNRPTLVLLGLALGLGAGLLFAAAFEVPRLLTVQTVEDARHYTSLPVLVTVPELLTPREQRRRRARRAALAFAGVLATLISAPALAALLWFTHVLELLAV